MTTDHTAAAERHREDATAASNAGAYGRAQVSALTAISHSIDALVAELRDEHHPDPNQAALLDSYASVVVRAEHVDPLSDPLSAQTWRAGFGYGVECTHDGTQVHADGSETCVGCGEWSRYGWHPDTSPAAEQDPLELEDGDPTVEQHRPDLAAYGRRAYASDIRHTPDPYSA